MCTHNVMHVPLQSNDDVKLLQALVYLLGPIVNTAVRNPRREHQLFLQLRSNLLLQVFSFDPLSL